VATADPDLKAAFRQAAGPHFDGMGPCREDHVDRGARMAFAFTADGTGSPKQLLAELSWLPCRGARVTPPTVEQANRVALRAAIRK
jgi:hypothetical protein